MSASPEKLFLVLLLTAALTTTCGYRPFFQPVNDEKLREVQQLVTDIPGFPDFKEVGSNTMADNSSILISKYYVSKAPYEDVKNFYFQFLTSHGWRIAEEKPLSIWGRDYGGKKLTFIKGELLLSIQYEGSNNVGRNYAFGYAWDSPEFRTRVRKLPLN